MRFRFRYRVTFTPRPSWIVCLTRTTEDHPADMSDKEEIVGDTLLKLPWDQHRYVGKLLSNNEPSQKLQQYSPHTAILCANSSSPLSCLLSNQPPDY